MKSQSCKRGGSHLANQRGAFVPQHAKEQEADADIRKRLNGKPLRPPMRSPEVASKWVN